MNTIQFSAAVSVNKGNVRNNNEDNFYFNGLHLDLENRDIPNTFENSLFQGVGLFGVFDGMGGEAMGEEASLIAAKTLKASHGRILKDDNVNIDKIILKAIEQANIRICKKIVESGERRIGTTFAALRIDDDTAKVYNVGDSRVYLLRSGKLSQISVDDTTAQRLVNLGMITKEKAKIHEDKHKLTQHLGIFPDEMVIEPHLSKEFELKKGDRLLLCSDGLTDMVGDEEIEQILSSQKSCKELSNALVDAALKNGGKDNVTAMVIAINSNSHINKRNKIKKVFPLSVLGICLVIAVSAFLMNMNKPKTENPEEIKAAQIYFTSTIAEIPVGKNDYLYIGYEPQNITDKKIEYSSSAPDIITIDSTGHYIAQKVGMATITAKLNGLEVTQEISVYDVIEDIVVQENLKLTIGETVSLKVKVLPDGAKGDLVYQSADESIASIDESGKIEALSDGRVNITISSGDVKKTVHVSVVRKENKPKPTMDKGSQSTKPPESTKPNSEKATVSDEVQDGEQKSLVTPENKPENEVKNNIVETEKPNTDQRELP